MTRGPSVGLTVGVGAGVTVAGLDSGEGEGNAADGVAVGDPVAVGDGLGVVGATACWQPTTRPPARMVASARPANRPVKVLMDE